MKKILIALMCFSFAGVATVEAQTAAKQEAVKSNPNGPKFKFKGGDVHDFGEVAEGPNADYTFEFTNTGKEPLIIQNANASCGCTTPEWPKEPILPGKTGKIKVSFATAGRGGQPFDKTVFLTSNAVHDRERYELRIKGIVKAKTDAKAGAAR
ncbi:MAG TPA: DUF1573 domain-containing protein [Flavipsychrobacter sp.]|nr:DUF1573 domain-containing protein [Flavipsychrobacter sp.]